MSKLKQKVEEFAAIATALPENLQVTCFELLLRHHLEGTSHPPAEPKKAGSDAPATGPLPPVSTNPPSETGSKQEDLRLNDLHVKPRKFLEKYAVHRATEQSLFQGEQLNKATLRGP